MRVLVIGAAGMIGRKLCVRLLADRRIGSVEITSLVMADAIASDLDRHASLVVDLAAPDAAQTLLATRPDVIFHLAAIVSGEAEQDFEKGYSVNLDGTRALFEAIRAIDDYHPRIVYTSSIAVFGAPYSGPITDTFFHTPLSSYGTQKAICELLLADYTRRGFFDGVGIRLPNICVRPGKANAAASGFFSNIIREPLAGRDAILPVADDVGQTHASPRATVEFLLRVALIESSCLGARRTLMMPGVPASIAEQIAALRRVAGDRVVARIRHIPDPAVMAMVAGWPAHFETARALSPASNPMRASMPSSQRISPTISVAPSQVSAYKPAMARDRIIAAGGIVVQRGDAPLIAIVRLRKRDDWVLPKGKLDAGETARAAAQREVLEETGHIVTVQAFLGTLAYPLGERTKIVHFWHMETGAEPSRKLMKDVSEVAWLPLDQALARLTRSHEQAFLAEVGPRAIGENAVDIIGQPHVERTSVPKHVGRLEKLWRWLKG